MSKTVRRQFAPSVALSLWGFLGASVLLAAAEALPIVQDDALIKYVSERADVLSLMALATLASISFSAWMVRQMFQQQRESVTNMEKAGARMDALIEELRRRPCVGQRHSDGFPPL